MSANILFGGLFHETHTFVDEITRADQVRVRRGGDLLARRGDGSTMDGFLGVAERKGWLALPTLEIGAMPSGTLDHVVFESFWQEFAAAYTEVRKALAPGSIDGVWLSLHGAMVTTQSHDPEGEFLERLRGLPGAADLPVFGVFDLHATFTEKMARYANGLVAYRENPHIDAFDMAALSAELLARALEAGIRPRMTTRTLPIVWPPTGTGTADSPVKELSAYARGIEAADPEIWAVNVVPGYSFADTLDTGLSIAAITTGTEPAARAHLDSLAGIAMSLREQGVPREWDLDAAIDHALSRRLSGPVALVEPADNIGGGAPGDCTTILRRMLARGMERSAVVINDPAAVSALAGAAPGERRRISVGGRGTPLDPGPLDVEVEFLSRSDGRFTLEDRNSHLAASQGVAIEMGPCATVRCGGTMILLTSRKTPPFDLGQLRSQGLVPEDLAFIGVKAAVAHRRAYEKIVAASYWVSTPGPCASDLTALPFRHIRRPIFPLDPPWRPA